MWNTWLLILKGNATATQTVIVEGNGETSDLEPKLTVPVGATIHVGDSFVPMAEVLAIDKEDGRSYF